MWSHLPASALTGLLGQIQAARPELTSPVPPFCLGGSAYPGSPGDGRNRKARGEALWGTRLFYPIPPACSGTAFLREAGLR